MGIPYTQNTTGSFRRKGRYFHQLNTSVAYNRPELNQTHKHLNKHKDMEHLSVRWKKKSERIVLFGGIEGADCSPAISSLSTFYE
jgi:hypothetical protein